MRPGVYLDWWTPIKHLGDLISGAGVTLAFAVGCSIISIIIGALFGYIRYNGRKNILYYPVTWYVELIRNTPLLVQIYLIFFGLPQLGIMMGKYQTGVIALVLFASAYNCENFRGGIQSIDKGQWEAGECLGLSKFWIFVNIIFPQVLRNIFPTLINQFVQTMYATALLSVLDIREITAQTKLVAGLTFRNFEMYTFAALFYYILSVITTLILRKINIRFFPSVSSKGE